MQETGAWEEKRRIRKTGGEGGEADRSRGREWMGINREEQIEREEKEVVRDGESSYRDIGQRREWRSSWKNMEKRLSNAIPVR